ncbi:MAG: hypothetical protein JNK64_04340 [Myxococcales bacterium]|nr:hypothetical protein [Myxococcales bacterium]
MLEAPFAPAPTILNGGIDRAVRCWEACREANPGGYGAGVVQRVDGWGMRVSDVTSCSPFTATATAMMLHRAASGDGGPDPLEFPPAERLWTPCFDGGTTPLPADFYQLSNGFYLSGDGEVPRRRALARILADLPADAPLVVARPGREPDDADRTSGALLLFNLGYEIEPADMRRGDFVGIAWGHWGAHASFCWDVHLAADGAVDAFQFVSANSGPGVSIAARDYEPFFATEHHGGQLTYRALHQPHLADRELNVTAGRWECLPGGRAADVDVTTFIADVPRRNCIDASNAPSGKYYVRALRVIRFWGVAPPERAAALDSPLAASFPLATALAREAAPPPFACARP